MNKVTFSNFEQFGSLNSNIDSQLDNYYNYSKFDNNTIEKENKIKSKQHKKLKTNIAKYQHVDPLPIPNPITLSRRHTTTNHENLETKSSQFSLSRKIVPAINTNKETIIMIDWDDTLFPTTWITRNNINVYQMSNMKPEYRIFFMKLDIVIYKFINQLMKYGKVFIITNATTEWINVTKKLLPNTASIFNWVKVISARELYSGQYPNNIDAWKQLCFQKVARKYMSKQKINNFISIGDALYEYEALVKLHKLGKQKKYLKTIKLLGESDYKHIMDQIIVLNENIGEIICHDNHLDLVFAAK